MTGRDWREDTTEFPTVDASGHPRSLPGDREPTHVVGPWALGTRDGGPTVPVASSPPGDGVDGWDVGPARGPVSGHHGSASADPEPTDRTSVHARGVTRATGRRRRLVRAGVAVGALTVVVGLAGAAGAAISADVSTAGTPSVSTPTASTDPGDDTAGSGTAGNDDSGTGSAADDGTGATPSPDDAGTGDGQQDVPVTGSDAAPDAGSPDGTATPDGPGGARTGPAGPPAAGADPPAGPRG